MKKKYRVQFYVYSDITEEVEASSEEQALEIAIEQAVENQPLVSWIVDEQQETNIEELQEE